MQNKNIIILFVLSVVAMTTLWLLISNDYKKKIADQFWLRQIVALEKTVSINNAELVEVDADISDLEARLQIKQDRKTTLENENLQHETKIKEIRTAIFYLNKALWNDLQQPISSD